MESIINNIKIFYEIKGEGIPTILIHGLGASHLLWLPQIGEFSKHFKTIYWDLRGHGYSEIPEGEYTIGDYVEDLNGLMDTLNIESANLCGVSMGGMICMDFAIKYPQRVRKLVLAGTASTTEDFKPEIKEMFIKDAEIVEKHKTRAVTADKFISLVYSEKFLKNVSKEVLEQIKDRISKSPYLGYVRAVRGLLVHGWSVADKLGKIDAPTLIIHGKEDAIFSIEAARRIHNGIKNSRLELFDVGHVVNIEAPKEFNKLVIEFLKS